MRVSPAISSLLLGFLLLSPLAAREAPSLAPELTEQNVTLDFLDKTVSQIFDSITDSSGLKFVFDEKTDLAKPLRVDLGTMSLDKALDMLMLQSKNFYKPLDGRTVLVAPDTRQKRQEYEDQVIQTFHLNNVESKQVVTLLRSMLQARQIAESSTHNSVTIKDTPDKVGIAARLIEVADRETGEVVVEVELLEVPGNAGLPAEAAADAIRSAPGVVRLAHPTLRIVNGRSGSIHIGDAIPVPTATSCDTGDGGQAKPVVGVVYQNVGIQIEVAPRINDPRNVTLDVSIEISSLAPDGSRGVAADQGPVISRRQLETTMRLADGETHVVSSLPPLSRSLGATKGGAKSAESELILLVTPRVTREPEVADDDLAPLWVGTEENMKM